MLESVKIARRQSEIRQALAELAAKPEPSEDETRQMDAFDREYRTNETRYRASLIAEDDERREAGAELETRDSRERDALFARYEVRQAALHLDEGRPLDGATAEIVAELRSQGGFRGVPVPFEALEQRAGETVADGTATPKMTAPIIDRLLADSVATAMRVRTVRIAQGESAYPIVTSNVTAGWADGELAPVAGPTPFTTAERTLAPDHTLGVQMRVSRKALKASQAGLEAAIRRDMAESIRVALDRAVFLGSGENGEPLGLVSGAATYGIASTAVNATASYAAIRAAVTTFMATNVVNSPAGVRMLMRPELWDVLDGQLLSGTATTEYDRLAAKLGAISTTSNALAAPTGSPKASTALLSTATEGVAPALLGLWGAVDVIRDPYADAASGGLRLTGLLTADVSVLRAEQLQVLTGLQAAA